MLLIDDPDRTVIEPLTAAAGTMEKLYDFDLMQGGGHIRGYKLSDTQMDAVAASLEGLTSDEAMQKKYGGCRSWVELADLADCALVSVISDEEHAQRRQALERLLR